MSEYPVNSTDPPSLPPDFATLHTPVDALLTEFGDAWQISRETLTIFVAVKKSGTATRVIAGTAESLLTALRRAEEEEAREV